MEDLGYQMFRKSETLKILEKHAEAIIPQMLQADSNRPHQTLWNFNIPRGNYEQEMVS